MIASYNELPPFKDLFEPDFENGKLYWKNPRSCKSKVGDEVGIPTPHEDKFRWHIGLKEGQFLRSHIIYFLRFGIWPEYLDHINRDPSDDRIANLREITRSKNAWNTSRSKKDDLPKNVYKRDKPKPYRGQFVIYGKRFYTDCYNTPTETLAAIRKIEKAYYGDHQQLDYYLDIKQGSDAWKFLRQHRVTGTSAHKLLQGMTIEEIIKESENTPDFEGNQFTERGHLLEPEAKQIYQELHPELKLHDVGAVINSDYPQTLYSPDSLVDLDGMLEVKGFTKEHHLSAHKAIDFEIYAQIQFGLFITCRKWCDFIQYCPDIEDIQQTFFVKRILPDEEVFAKFKSALQNTSRTGNEQVQSMAMTVFQAEKDLLFIENDIKEKLTEYQRLKDRLTEAKERLKTKTAGMGKIKQTYTDDLGNTLDISIYDTDKITCTDLSVVPIEYTSEEELLDVYMANGKFYHRVPNTQLVKNYFKAGKSLPDGFENHPIRNIRLKFNGRSI